MTEPGGAGQDRLDVEVVADASGFARGLQTKIDAQVKGIRARIRAEVDTARLQAQTEAAARRVEKTTQVKLKVGVDARFLRESIKGALAGINGRDYRVKIGVDLDKGNVEQELARLGGKRPRVKVDVDADTDQVRRELDDLGNRKPKPVEVKVKASGLKEVERGLAKLSRIGLIAGGIQLVTSAVVALGGGLFAMAASASQALGVLGALPNAVGILGQTIGTVLAGFSGIGDAVTAMGKAETAAGSGAAAAAKTREAAAKRVAAAQKAVSKAQQQADRTAQDGAKAVAAAQKRVGETRDRVAQQIARGEDNVASRQAAARTAQEALTRAREIATDRLKDYQLQLSGAGLNEEAAALAVERARERLDQANRSPASTDLDRREADLGLRQALQNLAEVQDSNKDLRKEAQDAYTAGVDGAANVVAAQEDVKQTTQDVADAEADLTQTRIDGASDIADAQQNLADTIADTSQANIDAQEAIVEAQENVAEAIADAADAANAANPAVTALAAAMDKLSPAGQRFARFVNDTLKPRIEELKKGIQEALLPGVQAGVEAALPALDNLGKGLEGTGTILGDVARRAGELIGSPLFRDDITTIMDSNNRATSSLGDASLSLLNVFRNLAVAAGPLIERFATFIATQADLLDKFISNKRETGELTEFFNRAGDKAALLGGIIADVVVALFNLGQAAKPVGDSLLNSLADAAAEFRAFTGDEANQAKFRKFFEDLEPLIKQAGDLLTTLVQIVVSLGENGGGALGGFLGTLQVIADALLAILNSPFGPFLSAILTLAGVGGALGLVGSKILGIADSIKGLVGGATEAVTAVRDGATSVSDFVGGLRDGVSSLQEGASTAAEWGAKIGDAARGAGTFARDLGTKVRDGVSTAATAVSSLGSRVASGLSSGVSAASTFASNLGSRVASAASTAASSIGNMAAAVGRGAAAFATSALNAGRAAAAWAAQAAAGVAVAAKNAIVTASTWALNAAQGALNAIMAINPFVLILIAIAALVAAFIYAWNNSETFRDIVTGVLTAIRDAAVAVFDFLVGFFTGTWDKISSIFTTVVGAIGSFLSGAWEGIKTVVTTVWNAISGFISGVWEGIKTVFTGAISFLQGVWSGLWNTLSSVASTIWNTIKAGIDGFLGGVQRGFENVVSVITTVWDGLKTAIRAPIQFVVDVVYNRGIVPVWNFVSGLFDGPQLDTYTLPQFAVGGTVPGYAPGKDRVPAVLSPGEGVLVPEAVRGIGGADGVQALNAAFSSRVAAPGGGRRRGLGAPRQEDHTKPPRFAGGGILDNLGDFASSIGNGISNAVDAIGDAIASGWRTAVHVGLQPFRSLAASTLPDNQIGEVLKGTVSGWFDKIEQFVGGKEEAQISAVRAIAGDVGAGVERWAPLVTEVLRELGQPASLPPSVLQLIKHESGGNPNAINRTDINAQRGYPSQGLMQTIPQTFAANAGPYKSRGITDPKANIYAGLNYGIRRYGSVQNIPGIRSLAQGGGYKPYDTGGPWRDGTLGGNTSGYTEGVLTGQPGGGMDRLGGFGVLNALNRGQSIASIVAGSRIDGRSMAPQQTIGTLIEDGAIRLTVINPRQETTEQTLNARLRALGAFGVFRSAPQAG